MSSVYLPESMQKLFGIIFSPVAWLLGVSWNDCAAIGELLGERLVTNEFIAFIDLGKICNISHIFIAFVHRSCWTSDNFRIGDVTVDHHHYSDRSHLNY